MGTIAAKRLAEIVSGGEFALARISTTYEPGGGPGSRVYPPTFPTDRQHDSKYLFEERAVNGEKREAVVLDQVPSQANRVEEAISAAQRAGEVTLPMLRISHDGQASATLTGLDLPHRVFDAYLRDTTLDGVKFDKTQLGKDLQAASLADATVLLQYDPGSLAFGTWNSHRPGRQAKFPRAYASEIVGWDPIEGHRKAGRLDPLNLRGSRTGSGDDWEYSPDGDKKKDQKLSEIGHGHIAPGDSHGGVTITSATRFATLSLTGLARLGFGDMPAPAQQAARVLLAAYALMGDRLAFGGPGLWLRSGCDLVVTDETLQWVGRGGVVEDFELDRAAALALFEDARLAAEREGVELHLEPVELTPSGALKKAIDFSLTQATESGE